MPAYDHLCENCEKEFELEYSMKDDPPTLCPLCGVDGQVKRLISYATPGRVELSGKDFQNKIKEDAKSLARETVHNENLRANLIGENKYNG